MLAAKQQRLEDDLHEMRKDVRRAADCVIELTATMKTMRWVVSIMVPAGVAIGVALVKVFLG